MILIETQDANGCEWGVSRTSSNPEPQDYIACKTKEDALRMIAWFSKLPNAALTGGEAVPSNGVVRPCLKCGATPKHGIDRAGLHEMRCACGNHVALHLTEARSVEVWNWSNNKSSVSEPAAGEE